MSLRRATGLAVILLDACQVTAPAQSPTVQIALSSTTIGAFEPLYVAMTMTNHGATEVQGSALIGTLFEKESGPSVWESCSPWMTVAGETARPTPASQDVIIPFRDTKVALAPQQ